MNLMFEVAKLLGVEDGKPFKVSTESKDTTCWYSKAHKNFYWEDSCGRGIMEPDVLYKCLENTDRITKKPWRPSYGEPYYFVNVADCDKFVTSGVATWYGDETDLARFHIGNCFETRDDADNCVAMQVVFNKIDNEVEAWT